MVGNITFYVSIKQLLSGKNAAHAAKLQNPSSTALHQMWKEIRSLTKPLKSNSTQIQTRHRNSMTQPKQHTVHPVRAKDGVTLIKYQKGILSRWVEHLSELLNCINPIYFYRTCTAAAHHTWSWAVTHFPWNPCRYEGTQEQQSSRARRPSCRSVQAQRLPSLTSTPPLHRQRLVLGLYTTAVKRC